MKIYQVIWTEKHSVNVKAESKEQATNLIMNSSYDEMSVSSEIDMPPEAYEVNYQNIINKMNIQEIYGYEQPTLARNFADFYNKFASTILSDKNYSLSDEEISELFNELVLMYMRETMAYSEWERITNKLK